MLQVFSADTMETCPIAVAGDNRRRLGLREGCIAHGRALERSVVRYHSCC